MPDKEDKESGRGIPAGLREAIDGAFAASERTRAQAQGLSDKTRAQAQGLVDEVSRRGQDARGTLDGLRLVSRDELRIIEDRIEELSSRIAELEAKSKPQVDG